MKYQNLKDYLINEIATESLNSGDKLPSIRQLAIKFSYSKSTVVKSLTELENEHVIYSVPQKGFFVTEKLQPKVAPSKQSNFLSAGPDLSFVSFDNLKHCSNQIIANHKQEILSYGAPEGMDHLRQQIQKYFQDSQVFTSLNRIIITSGAQQAINILINMPFGNNRENILVEQPTYAGILQAAKLTNRKIIGIDISQDSINLDELEHIFQTQAIKFFYVMPRFQNPLGHSYTTKERQRMIELANKYDVYIVEDDFLGDLDLDSRRDPLFSLDPSGRVIYLKSFSKVFLPSLRLAAVVVPEFLLENFLEYKSYLDSYTSTISQEVLATFMDNGMFSVHLQKIKQLYAQKMTYTIQLAQKYHLNINQPQTGFYTTITLPKGVNATILKQQLAQENVLVDDVKRMFLPLQKNTSLIRLSISQVERDRIDQGLKIIAQTIAKYDPILNPVLKNSAQSDTMSHEPNYFQY